MALGRSRRANADLDDLDELQVVTRREYRRGYQAQVDGRPMRLRYRKIMKTDDGVLVHRPAAGQERPRRMLWGIPRALLIVAITAWPVTLLVGVLLVALVVVGMRALL